MADITDEERGINNRETERKAPFTVIKDFLRSLSKSELATLKRFSHNRNKRENWEAAALETINRKKTYGKEFKTFTEAEAAFQKHLSTLPTKKAKTKHARQVYKEIAPLFNRKEWQSPSHDYDKEQLERLKRWLAFDEIAQTDHVKEIQDVQELAMDTGNLEPTTGGKKGGLPKNSPHGRKTREEKIARQARKQQSSLLPKPKGKSAPPTIVGSDDAKANTFSGRPSIEERGASARLEGAPKPPLARGKEVPGTRSTVMGQLSGIFQAEVAKRAIERRRDKEGHVPSGQLAYADESRVLQFGRFLADPTFGSDIPLESRLNIAKWRQNLIALTNQKKAGDTLEMVWQVGTGRRHADNYQETENVKIIYRKLKNGWWIALSYGSDDWPKDASISRAPEINEIIDPKISDDYIRQYVLGIFQDGDMI